MFARSESLMQETFGEDCGRNGLTKEIALSCVATVQAEKISILGIFDAFSNHL